jgi:folate-dependent tRNA-U54 methylase TrmFO/GidA
MAAVPVWAELPVLTARNLVPMMQSLEGDNSEGFADAIAPVVTQFGIEPAKATTYHEPIADAFYE